MRRSFERTQPWNGLDGRDGAEAKNTEDNVELTKWAPMPFLYRQYRFDTGTATHPTA